MIVNYTAKGWDIVTQRAHGLLAAQIAAHWHHSVRTDRWVETLLAIAEHDDAQIEINSNDLLTPNGGPLNFNMKVYDDSHCQHTFTASLTKSRYIALLSSIHLDFVYKAARDVNGTATKFLDEQVAWRKACLKDLKITNAQIKIDYGLLEWCDALSLLLCQYENQPEQRTIEISNGPNNKHYQLLQTADNKLMVEPWPFEEDNFNVQYEYRTLNQLQFNDSTEFRTAFLNAEVMTRYWAFEKK